MTEQHKKPSTAKWAGGLRAISMLAFWGGISLVAA